MHSPVHHEILKSLAALRCVTTSAPTAVGLQVDPLLDEISRQVEQLLGEHAGMADDLLRTYEQLGIVFEVTRSLSVVQSEEEVVGLFVNSLRATYQDNEVCVARRKEGGDFRWDTPPTASTPRMLRAIRRAAENQKVRVQDLAGLAGKFTEMLCAPVVVGQATDYAIVFLHGPTSKAFEARDMSLAEALVQFCGDVIRNHRLASELRQLSKNMVRALVGAIDQKDEYTSGHSNRVGHFSRLLGEEIGLSEAELKMLEWSALLHDVGKIGIRDDVLKKPGRLTKEEFEHIKEHPVRSYELVRRVPQLAEALNGVHHHHEHYDGNGYPDGLAGDDIPLQARIIQVADIYDALTTTRSYRKAFTVEKALSILREEAGKVCDPNLVPRFEALIKREQAQGTLPVAPLVPETNGSNAKADDTGNPVRTPGVSPPARPPNMPERCAPVTEEEPRTPQPQPEESVS